MNGNEGDKLLKQIQIQVEVIEIMEDVPMSNLSSIPDCCGAYVIKVKSGKTYVGSSKTVRTRIRSHNVYNDPNITEDMELITFYLTNSHMNARILEYWLIRELNPELNFEIRPDASTWKE